MNLDGLILIERKGNVKFYRKGRKFYQNIGDGEIIPLKDGDIRYKKIKTVNGKPFDPKANYNICVTTFLSTGGDAYALLAEYAEKSSWDIGYQELDALTNYLGTALKGKMDDKYRSTEGRITIIK